MRKLQWILHGEKDSLNALGEMKLVPLTLSEPSRRSLPIPCNNQISRMENSTCVLTHEALWASSPLTGHGTLPRASLVDMVEIPHMGASSKGLLSPQREGTGQKKGICDVGALVLHAAAAPGGTKRPLRAARAGSCLLCAAFQSIILSN